MPLVPDQATNIIQAMPFKEGLIGITSGTVENITLIHCNVTGDLTLTFVNTGTEVNVTMEAGSDRSIALGSSVTVLNGEFDFA